MNREKFCQDHPEIFQYHRYGVVPDAIKERPEGISYKEYKINRMLNSRIRNRLMRMGVRARTVKKIVARTKQDGSIVLVNKGLGTLRYKDYAF